MRTPVEKAVAAAIGTVEDPVAARIAVRAAGLKGIG
jgi:hypothetical protein